MVDALINKSCCSTYVAPRICITQGDEDPSILFRIFDSATCCPKDLSVVTTVVIFKFRKRGETENIFQTTGEIVWSTRGYVKMNWPQGSTDVEPGNYEIEVTVDVNGRAQTICKSYKVRVCPSFSDITILNAVSSVYNYAICKDCYVEFCYIPDDDVVRLFVGTTSANKTGREEFDV